MKRKLRQLLSYDPIGMIFFILPLSIGLICIILMLLEYLLTGRSTGRLGAIFGY